MSATANPLPTAEPREIPRSGETWKHYEGSTCQVQGVATRPNSPDQVVVYHCSGAPGQLFFRPLEVWLSEAQPGVPRFTRVRSLSAVPSTPTADRYPPGFLRELINEGLDPADLGFLREVLEERRHQDRKWGRVQHSGAKWVLIVGKWFGKLCSAVLVGETSGLRRRCKQMAALALAIVELGVRHDPQVDPEAAARSSDPALDAEDWLQPEIGGEA